MPHGSRSIVSNFWLSICMHLLSYQISTKEEGTMVDRTAGGVKDGEIISLMQRIICQQSSSGSDLLEEQLHGELWSA